MKWHQDMVYTFQQWLRQTGSTAQRHADAPTARQGLWKKLGVLGFLFFLLKGLLWLTLPAWYFFCSRTG